MPVPLLIEVCPQSAAGAFLVPELYSMKGPRKSLSLMPLDGKSRPSCVRDRENWNKNDMEYVNVDTVYLLFV